MVDVEARRKQALMALEDRTVERRREGAQMLLELLDEESVPDGSLTEAIAPLTADADDVVRTRGVRLAAALLQGDELDAFLRKRLSDPSDTVRLEATGQMADLADPDHRGALAGMLQDSRFEVRFEAARGIASLRHSAGLDVLVEALDIPALRYRALGALGELGDVKALPAVERMFRKWFLSSFERTQAAGTMALLGNAEGARHLVARTKKGWTLDRPLAIELCGEVKAPGAFELLRAILSDPKDPCRGTAARGLGRLKDPAAIPILLELFRAERISDDLRLDAAEGLCLAGDTEARRDLEAGMALMESAEARSELAEMLKAYDRAGEPLGRIQRDA